MNKCQMSNNINSSAPSSPTGTIAATDSIDQQVTDNQQPRLSRSRSLSDISQGESPKEDQQQQTQQVAQESLKVKIRTNNILSSNNNSLSDREGSSDTNNITKNNIANNKPTTESTNTKASISSNNKVSKNKGNKASNLANNNSTSNKTSNSPKNLLENNISENNDTTRCSEINMNNHGESNSSAENGKSSAQPQPLSTQPNQQSPPPTSAPQAQSQQQLQQPPLSPLFQSTPQSQMPLSKPSPTPESNKLSKSPATPVEPKPKATRARKQPAASNKGANASNATPKPESKRTKKAKQNAENTATTKPTTVPSTQLMPTISSTPATPSSTADNKNASNSQQSPTAPPTKKRKPRATATNSTSTPATNEPTLSTVSPPKRTRKKKGDPVVVKTDNNNQPPMSAASITIPSINVANPQLLSVTSNVPMGSSPLVSNVPMPPLQQPNINRQMLVAGPLDAQDPANRYYSLTISPYANYDYGNAASLTRPSLSRLFTSSSSAEIGHSNSHSDELSRAFEDLRDNSWSHLSKCILEQAQQFDIPSLIGTLYTLRLENDKLANKVRDLTQKRDQLIAMNARLELPGSSLIPHLNHTSPNFSSVVAGLTNSPKSLPISSPSPAMNKSPIVPGGSYNHLPHANSFGPPGFIDRSSPLVGLQIPHSGVNNLKSSTISTPSPPTGALMAHGANNRASLMTVNNPPYVSNVHPSMNALNLLGGPNPPSSSYYPRQ